MCGIFGAINCSSVNQKSFERSVELLKHRGPDSTKLKFWENVAFGFVRLSIQDLSSAGDQPMSHSSKPIHIVFNGEIYNFKILRDKLIKAGAVFFSHSDTEVILHAYAIWGWEQTLKCMEGMFALALYDEGAKKVFLARDRFGMKPLFYARAGSYGLIVSSEIKSILNYTGRARIDFLNSLNPLFTTGLSPKGKTVFEGVEQLQEGSYLEYDLLNKTYRTKRFFHVADWIDESQYREISGYSQEKLLEVYKDAFVDSVQQHLISDAPLASLFSAGVDSTIVTKIAAKYKPVSLYHFESEMLDLLSYPRSFANEHGLDLIISKGNDRNYIFDLPRMIYSYETVNKEEGPVLANLCRLAHKDGIKVLLTGDAGDELFGGQPHHVAFMIQNSFYHSKAIRNIMRGINHFFPYNITKYRRESPLGTYYNIFPPSEHLNEVPLNCLYHRGERLKDWQNCLGAYSFVKDNTERELLAYMLDEINYRLQRFMIRADRIGMMESVELRIPFLHPAIVRLVVNTPTNWRMRKKTFWRGYEKKYIIKELAIKLGLSRSLSYREKITTPHNSFPQVTKILKNWKLRNLSELLKISPDVLRDIALESFDPDLCRIQYAFVAMETLMRLFIDNDHHEKISEEFKSIIGDKQSSKRN